MGTYRNVYIGAYMLVPIKKEEKTETFPVKPNGKRAKSKFNPETGEKYETKTVTTLVDDIPSDWGDEVEDNPQLAEDDLFRPAYFSAPKGYTLFLSNWSDKGCLNHDDGDTTEISTSVIDSSIKSFTESFKHWIEFFESKYGKVEVKFGVVDYAH